MRRYIYFSLLVVLSALVMITACEREQYDIPDIPMGIIEGQVIAPNGTTPIPMAKVFVDYEGDIYLTLSDVDGNFALEAPQGNHTLHIQSGDGSTFRTTLQVTVVYGTNTVIPSGTTTLLLTGSLAYIPGKYDVIEEIIIDSLGYTATQLQVSDLDNLTQLQTYDALFLNCGKYAPLDSTKYAHLKIFAENGGSIYVSDWAVEYLTGDGHYKGKDVTVFPPERKAIPGNPKPGCIGEAGGFIPDSVLCTTKMGPVTTIAGASIDAIDIQTYLGKTTLDIEYDLANWEKVEHYTSPWEVLVSDATYGPLAMRMNMPDTAAVAPPAPGTWITICHYPPGNPSNPITITISASAWPAHQAHGDQLGPCAGLGGNIYFTTFHNEPQGHISGDVRKILEYFILNL